MDSQDFAPKGLRAEVAGCNLPAIVPEVVLMGEALLDKAKSVAQDIKERVRLAAAAARPRHPSSGSSEGVPSG
jgi:hypothetical protein